MSPRQVGHVYVYRRAHDSVAISRAHRWWIATPLHLYPRTLLTNASIRITHVNHTCSRCQPIHAFSLLSINLVPTVYTQHAFSLLLSSFRQPQYVFSLLCCPWNCWEPHAVYRWHCGLFRLLVAAASLVCAVSSSSGFGSERRLPWANWTGDGSSCGSREWLLPAAIGTGGGSSSGSREWQIPQTHYSAPAVAAAVAPLWELPPAAPPSELPAASPPPPPLPPSPR